MYKKGVCARCGKILENKRAYYCDECREIAKQEKLAKNRAKYKYRMENGLCKICGRPVLEGTHLCEAHYKVYIQRLRKNYPLETSKEYRKENGLCLICGKPVENPMLYWCDACRKRQSDISKKNHPKTGTQTKEELSEKLKKKYLNRKENGLCTICGEPATHGLHCFRHYIKEKRKYERKKAEQAAISAEKRKNRICIRCGSKIEEGSEKQWCKACREKQAQQTKKFHEQGIYKNSRKIWSRQDTLLYQHQPKNLALEVREDDCE